MPTPRPQRKPPIHLDIERKLGLRTPREPMRHYIAGARQRGRNWWLHATKGWRTEASR